MVELDHTDLVNLVFGSSPYYDVFGNKLVKECGSWTGGFVDQWNWNRYKLEKLSDNELLELYSICKNSWPNRAQN